VNYSEPRDAGRSRAVTLTAVGLLLAVSVVGIFDHDAWNPHEFRVGGIIREMVDAGDWVVPTLGGEPFLEKPPLYYRFAAGCHALIGGDAARAMRAASLLFGIATLLAVARIAFLFLGRRGALVSAAVLATSVGFLHGSHFLLTDTALVAFVALSFWAFVESRERRKGFRWLGWFFLGCSILSKGLIGPALVLPALFIWLLWERDLKAGILALAPVRGTLVLALTVAPWLVALYLRDDGRLFWWWVEEQTVDRFASSGKAMHHDEGPLFYFPGLALMFLPWTAWLVVGWFVRRKDGGPGSATLSRLAIAWAGWGFLLLSAAQTKREIYLIPLLAGWALLTANWLAGRDRLRGARTWTVAIGVLTALLPPLALAGHLSGKLVYPSPLPTFLLGAAAAAAGIWLLVRLARRPEGFGMPAFWLAPCVLVVTAILLFFPPADVSKSHKAGMEQLVRVLPEEKLTAYKLGETVIGSLSFHTGLRPPNLLQRRDLAAWIDDDPEGILIMRISRWPFVEPLEGSPHVMERIDLNESTGLLLVRPHSSLRVAPK